jgi:hypothetical protein
MAQFLSQSFSTTHLSSFSPSHPEPPPHHSEPPTRHSELVSESYLHPETRFRTASGMTPALSPSSSSHCHPELVSESYLHPETRFRTASGMTPALSPSSSSHCHPELVSGSHLHPETRFRTASGMTTGLPCHPSLIVILNSFQDLISIPKRDSELNSE